MKCSWMQSLKVTSEGVLSGGEVCEEGRKTEVKDKAQQRGSVTAWASWNSEYALDHRFGFLQSRGLAIYTLYQGTPKGVS